MEKKETQSTSTGTKHARILACVHLINGKEALEIYAKFPFPVEIKDMTPRIKPGHIRRRKGEPVSTNLLEFRYKEKENGKTEIHFPYTIPDIGEWDFITVKFCPEGGDCQDHEHKDAEEILNHVSGSTVHYGDAD